MKAEMARESAGKGEKADDYHSYLKITAKSYCGRRQETINSGQHAGRIPVCADRYEDGKNLLRRMNSRDKGTCRYLHNHHTLSSLMKDDFFQTREEEMFDEDTDGNPVYQFEKAKRCVFRTYLEYGSKPIVDGFYAGSAVEKVASGGRRRKGFT